MNLKIEKTTIKDLPAILKIEQMGFSPAEAGSETSFRDRLQKLSSTFLVAKDGDRVVGFVVAVAAKEKFVLDEMYEETPTNLKTGGNLLILSIAIDPEYRGNGIGSKLLSSLENDARLAHRETISLDSLDHNIPFYEHNGFEKVKVSQSQHANETWYSLVKKLK